MNTGACVRAIDAGYRCRVGNDRMAIMTHPREDCGGKTLLELLWDQLMEEYGSLMGELAGVLDEQDPRYDSDQHPSAYITQGIARGLAQAIAFITNPYAPNVDAVRTEAAARWEASNEQS